MLEVRLIGRFDIQCDGKPVILSSRAAQSLFAYLTLTAGTLHRREKLAGMLWPDESEQKARAYLRNELWRIRKALPQTSEAEYLVADNLTVGFDHSSAYWLDIAGLKKLSDTSSAEELIQALSSYRGELLPGFYEDWVVVEREHWQVLFEQKVAYLLEILEKEQRWHDILEWAERWIALGQGPEAAYRTLMIAYDTLGDHAKVASTYERCKQALRQLDLEPSEETRALAFKRSSKIKVPIPLTSFIGREKELKEVTGLFSKSRLITLTGSGGVGKTRLVIQIVAEILELFPDGVWFLDLAPLNDPALLPNTLTSLLGLQESGKQPATGLLINYFRSRTALVIFDNCEHLIEPCAQLIHSLLTSCEALSILATSREALRVAGEISYRVPSLAVPESGMQFGVNDLANMESLRLFTERAALISPGFVFNARNAFEIARICQKLDGIPLAIELAAARTHLLSTQEILTGLDDRFHLLTRGLRSALPRHQTLRAMIEWSYDLLTKQERILFRQLAVFMGGWTLEAAKEVCVRQNDISSNDILDLLTQLVNKSLVIVMEHSQSGETRYRMLETTRQYARVKLLEAGGSEVIHDRHLAYFVKLTEQAAPELYRSNQVFWLSKFDDELDNLRKALERALDTNLKLGIQLIINSAVFWEVRSDIQEVQQWLARFLEQYTEDDSLRARALVIYGNSLATGANHSQAQIIANHSLELSRTISDKHAEAFSLLGLGAVMALSGNIREGIPIVQQSLALYRSLGDKLGQANATGWLGLNSSDLERSRSFLLESLKLHRELGNLLGIAFCLNQLVLNAILEGDFSSPVQWLKEAMLIHRQLEKRRGEVDILGYYGLLFYWQGDYRQACSYFEESISLGKKIGISQLDWLHVHMGYARLRQGNVTEAKELFEFCARQFQNANNTIGLVYTIEGLASLHMYQKELEQATRLFAWANIMREKIGDSRPPVEQNSVERDLVVIHSKLNDAEFARFSAEGSVMMVEQAIALALETMDET